MDNLSELCLQSTQVYDGAFLKVYKDTVSLPNQAQSLREYIKHPGAVVIIPILPNGNFLIEKQFRYPLHSVFFEFPAGKMDKGESPLQTAVRELKEETGYESGEIKYLGTIHPCIGYSDEKIEVFLATHLELTASQNLDDNEFIDLFELSPSDFKEMVVKGLVTDGKSIAALGLYMLQTSF